MNADERVRHLCALLDREAEAWSPAQRQSLGRVLGQLVHDISNAQGSPFVDVHLANLALERLQQGATDSSRADATARDFDEVKRCLTQLQLGAEQMSAHLTALADWAAANCEPS